MEELIRQVAERTGISEAQAQTAVNTVLGFIKGRLPEPLAGQLDGLLGGAAGAGGAALGGLGGAAGSVLGGLGGMLGGGDKE
ncbi:MAG: DUF2267 domain-containing protein [Acidobacteria bacterium]|nr:DUF2267 domain-containing protein [Acidobacteriota bacterium]